MKSIYKFFAMLVLLLCFAGTALAAEKEVSSIDAIDMGVADTGETHLPIQMPNYRMYAALYSGGAAVC